MTGSPDRDAHVVEDAPWSPARFHPCGPQEITQRAHPRLLALLLRGRGRGRGRPGSGVRALIRPGPLRRAALLRPALRALAPIRGVYAGVGAHGQGDALAG